MYANRYGTRQVDPGSLTLSVGIVGGLVAAAMLSTTVIDTFHPEKTFRIFTVAPPPEPPPPNPTPPQPSHTPPRTTIVAPTPIVPTITPVAPLVTQPDPGPPVDLSALSGTGSAPVVVDPPRIAPPVLVGAQPDPRYMRDFQPSYPSEERRAGNEGVVTVRVLIGVDGRVREVERLASPSDNFWRVTQQQALSHWRFRPATRDGAPYEVWRTMTVRFRLETD